MKHTVSGNGSTNEWHYGFYGYPYDPQQLMVTYTEMDGIADLWRISQFHSGYYCRFCSLTVASDRGMKVTLKAFYSLIRELACDKQYQDFNATMEGVLKARYGGFWKVYARG